MSDDPVGTLAEEAAKLLSAVVARAVTPEVRVHLAQAAASLALAMSAALESFDQPASQPSAERPPAGMEKIDLMEGSWD